MRQPEGRRLTHATSQNAAINLRLAQLGLPLPEGFEQTEAARLTRPILARQRELSRRLSDRLCAADGRIQAFLDDYLADTGVRPQLPHRALVLDEAGLARELSLPFDGDSFSSPLLSSYRLVNGVLHNPANDRRTTAGVLHVAEGGLPIPDDKISVPKAVFARLLEHAFEPPQVDMVLPENDASLATDTWSGHTGCVVLAPHLTRVTKRSLGLPHVSEATDLQRRDGMCWENEDELYNGGRAFKACARDARGVIVTVIADTYFGYCKKEVKTQISYSANLLGNAEEEHSGGALVFASYDLGQEYDETSCGEDHTLAEVLARDPERFALQPQGHALDTEQPHIVLVPAHPTYSLRTMTVSWDQGSIPLRADRTYLSPNGYRVRIAQQPHDPASWSLIGTVPTATSCHKPATVSGGGKSEISKAITDAFVFGPAFVADLDTDMDAVAEILALDFSRRFRDPARHGTDLRPILSPERSIGSVIKLLTPSPSEFHDDYNDWLAGIAPYVKELVYVVKRSCRPEWGDDWRSHFSVAAVDGRQGNSLRLDGTVVTLAMLRVGYDADGSKRLFSLRHDFSPAVKVQTQDDITASTVVPGARLGLDPARSYKLVENCESLLFQRPDDAIHRGYDTQAERDIATPGTFPSNFAPLTREDAVAMRDDAVTFTAFSPPMAQLLRTFADTGGGGADGDGPAYVVSSANPRLVDGKPSKNPRYLQQRPDRTDAPATAVAELSERLALRLPAGSPLPRPVDVVAAGRRNNPPEGTVPPLCSYGPLHYMEPPELFMEFISSMTGKSPSTTGAGSEGALTKGPFNAMPAIVDLNASLLSYVLTGHDGWLSAAGHVGPDVRVDHDFSLLVPELFSRMTADERDARNLIAEGALERLEDFDHDGAPVAASRLGYRMTEKMATKYFGRIFLHPDVVFTPQMLRPELQDARVFAESMATIAATHERVARAYFKDGTVDLAVPPLRALLEIMADGTTSRGWQLGSPEFRTLFTRESVLASDWYAQRLDAQQAAAVARADAGLAAIEQFVATPGATRSRRSGSACPRGSRRPGPRRGAWPGRSTASSWSA